MPRLPQRRKGRKAQIKGRPLQFSFWPVYRGQTRFGLQSTVFALDPWTIITSSIKKRCSATSQAEAFAHIEQARDFYKASVSAQITAARPLLLYYCFMNLAKAYVLTAGTCATLDQAGHGLSEQLRVPQNRELTDAYLKAFASPNARNKLQVFDEYYKVISAQGLITDKDFELPKLLPQIVPGHRLWAEAADKNERFIALHDVRVMENRKDKTLWLNLYLFADDLSRLRVTINRLLTESQLGSLFRQVTYDTKVAGRRLICLEQRTVKNYIHRAADKVHEVVHEVKNYLWATVASVSPYRRYYIYIAPTCEHDNVLPQLLSIYAITFYLGSITRYRPHHFDKILADDFGPRIEEFVGSQPLQFIYLMASEFAEREVVKPSIV